MKATRRWHPAPTFSTQEVDRDHLVPTGPTSTTPTASRSCLRRVDQSAAHDAALTCEGLDVNQGFVVVQGAATVFIVAPNDGGSIERNTLQGS